MAHKTDTPENRELAQELAELMTEQGWDTADLRPAAVALDFSSSMLRHWVDGYGKYPADANLRYGIDRFRNRN